MSKLLICFIAFNFLHAQILADEPSADVTLPIPPYCGGQSADVNNNNPWLVYVLHRPDFSTDDTRCAGTLINSHWVLTAAHCVTGFVKFIELGDRTTARVDKKVLHPEFNEHDKVFKSDIALLRLTSPLNYTQEVQPICLPLKTNEIEKPNYDNTEVDVAFWSDPVDEELIRSDVKKSATISILKTETCQKALTSKNIPFEATQQICVDNKVCLENDGEILQLKKNEAYYQIGLMSNAVEDCSVKDDISNVFNRIDSFVDWIAEVIKNNQ